jgi:hypothetical protein
MIATLEITGVVSDVDLSGYILIGGITIAVDTSTLGLPSKGQAIYIKAHLMDLPADPKEAAVWQASTMQIYALAQPAPPKAAPAVPHERAHHLPLSSPAQSAPASAPAKAAPQPTGAASAVSRFPAAVATGKPHPTVAPQNSAAPSRFPAAAHARPVAHAAQPVAAGAAPADKTATVSSFGSRFGKTSAAPAAGARAPAAQQRPAFAPGATDHDDDIPF